MQKKKESSYTNELFILSQPNCCTLSSSFIRFILFFKLKRNIGNLYSIVIQKRQWIYEKLFFTSSGIKINVFWSLMHSFIKRKYEPFKFTLDAMDAIISAVITFLGNSCKFIFYWECLEVFVENLLLNV